MSIDAEVNSAGWDSCKKNQGQVGDLLKGKDSRKTQRRDGQSELGKLERPNATWLENNLWPPKGFGQGENVESIHTKVGLMKRRDPTQKKKG